MNLFAQIPTPPLPTEMSWSTMSPIGWIQAVSGCLIVLMVWLVKKLVDNNQEILKELKEENDQTRADHQKEIDQLRLDHRADIKTIMDDNKENRRAFQDGFNQIAQAITHLEKSRNAS